MSVVTSESLTKRPLVYLESTKALTDRRLPDSLSSSQESKDPCNRVHNQNRTYASPQVEDDLFLDIWMYDSWVRVSALPGRFVSVGLQSQQHLLESNL